MSFVSYCLKYILLLWGGKYKAGEAKNGKWKIAVDFTIYNLLFTGFNNVVIGKLAGEDLTSADANVIIGEDAGKNQNNEVRAF